MGQVLRRSIDLFSHYLHRDAKNDVSATAITEKQ